MNPRVRKKRKLMFYAMLVVAAVLCLVAAAYLIGLALPESHTASRAAIFRASPETLFALVSGPQDWRTRCEPVAAALGNPRQWREISRHGAILFEEVKSDPPRLYEMRIADAGLPFGGTWTFELSPRDGGTRVRITEHGVVHSPLFRFISRFIMGHTATIDGYLRGMATKLGENVVIENG